MPQATDSTPGDALESRLSASLARQFPAVGHGPTFVRPSERSWRKPIAIAAAVAVPLLVAGTVATLELGQDDVPAGSYALPSNGWEPGDASEGALVYGRFHAERHRDGIVCAWIGTADEPVPTLWPKGWRVRFHPAQLLDSSGKVIATAGDRVKGGGGFGHESRGDVARCGADPVASITLVQRIH